MRVRISVCSDIRAPGATPVPDRVGTFIYVKDYIVLDFAYNPKIEEMCAICKTEEGKLYSFPISRLMIVD